MFNLNFILTSIAIVVFAIGGIYTTWQLNTSSKVVEVSSILDTNQNSTTSSAAIKDSALNFGSAMPANSKTGNLMADTESKIADKSSVELTTNASASDTALYETNKPYSFYLDNATKLADLINNHTFAPGEPLNLVVATDGAYRAALASSMINHKIDTLVVLGMPMHPKYKFDQSNIIKFVNVYAAYTFSDSHYPGKSGKIDGAINIDVTDIALNGAYTNEDDFYFSAEVWSRVKPHVGPDVTRPDS